MSLTDQTSQGPPFLNDRTLAAIVYILYLVALGTAFTALVGFVTLPPRSAADSASGDRRRPGLHRAGRAAAGGQARAVGQRRCRRAHQLALGFGGLARAWGRRQVGRRARVCLARARELRRRVVGQGGEARDAAR